ncbi:hypothetical protein BH09BAC5_BH09BAC5_24620 [soil metagenome]
MAVRFPLLILFFIFISGCKKYPEGGHLFSLNGVDVRIEKKWKIVSFTVDGADSLPLLKSNPVFCESYQLQFAHSKTLGNLLINPCSTFGNNYWGVSDDKKILKLAFHFSSVASELYPIQINDYVTVFWNIQLLKKEELWLKTNLNGKVYFVKLEEFK